MRIAIVAPPYFELPPQGYGAVELVCSELSEALVELGHDVVVIGAGRGRLNAQFIPVRESPQGPRWHEPMPELVHAAGASNVPAGLNVDVVHDHTVACPLVAHRHSAPTIVTPHSPILSDHSEYYNAIGQDVHLVALSHAQRRSAPWLNWIDVVYNGVAVHTFPYREEKGDYVFFMGRCSPQKGVHLAIDAARAAGFRILLAGTYTLPQHRAYFHEMVEPRLGPDARWLGEAGPKLKRDLLSQARCLLLPACWEEPFGLVMVEALACGTPVVALRRGAVPEVVTHGVTGLVCDEPAELPMALHNVDKLSPRRCRQEAALRFDVSVMARGYERVYRKVTDQSCIRGGRATGQSILGGSKATRSMD